MTRWDQTYVVICATVLSFAVVAAMLQTEFVGPVILGCTCVLFFLWIVVTILSEFDAIRERLDRVDRRTARIEGHLFGSEIPQEPENGQ